MEFSFRYRVKPMNVWILSMINMYRSMVGVVNIVFTLSMVLLALRYWPGAGLNLRVLMSAGILLFPAIQPFFIWRKSIKIVSKMPSDMEMSIDIKGIEVISGENRSHVNFADLKSITRISGMIVLYTHSKQSFILDREALDGQDEKLFRFLSQVAI